MFGCLESVLFCIMSLPLSTVNHSISTLFVCLFKLWASVISITESPCCSLFHQKAPGGKIIDCGPVGPLMLDLSKSFLLGKAELKGLRDQGFYAGPF